LALASTSLKYPGFKYKPVGLDDIIASQRLIEYGKNQIQKAKKKEDYSTNATSTALIS
jgi:hypothetical protein